jgi:hypothetical protein
MNPLCFSCFPFLNSTEIQCSIFFLQLYICDENSTATEYDFKKALELLAFIEDEFDRSELR